MIEKIDEEEFQVVEDELRNLSEDALEAIFMECDNPRDVAKVLGMMLIQLYIVSLGADTTHLDEVLKGFTNFVRRNIVNIANEINGSKN